MKKITELSVGELIAALSEEQKDGVFRAVWYTHVCEDAENLLAENYPDINSDEIEALSSDVANDYVYNGNYDCNKDYWANLNTLIGKFRKDGVDNVRS